MKYLPQIILGVTIALGIWIAAMLAMHNLLRIRGARSNMLFFIEHYDCIPMRNWPQGEYTIVDPLETPWLCTDHKGEKFVRYLSPRM